jgi:hypothetical protein
MKQQQLPRNQFIGIKVSAVELCDWRKAARKAPSVSAFIRECVAKAIAEQHAGVAP